MDRLADIAGRLDRQEAELLGGTASGPSSNVDESGNFSIDVLREALQTAHNITLETTTAIVDAALTTPTANEAYVLNHHAHWFAIRKIHGTYWNLNSTSATPRPISDFYLAAYLAQMRQEGYSIFVAGPPAKLPPPPPSRSYALAGRVHAVSRLFSSAAERQRREEDARTATADEAAEDPQLAAALAASKHHADAEVGGWKGGAGAGFGAGMDEETQLAMALSLSATGGAAASVSSSASATAAHGALEHSSLGSPTHRTVSEADMELARSVHGPLDRDTLVALILSTRPAAPAPARSPSPAPAPAPALVPGQGSAASRSSAACSASSSTASTDAKVLKQLATMRTGMAILRACTRAGSAGVTTKLRVTTMHRDTSPGGNWTAKFSVVAPAAATLAWAVEAQVATVIAGVPAEVLPADSGCAGATGDVLAAHSRVLEAAQMIQSLLGVRLAMGVCGGTLQQLIETTAEQTGVSVPTVDQCCLRTQALRVVPESSMPS